MISILIVDSHNIERDRIRDLIGEILREIPHPPVTLDYAGSAEEAVGVLSTESFNLLITGYEFSKSGMNGLELIRHVSGRLAMKKVLITGDSPSLEMRIHAAEAGVDRIFKKPVSREKLREVIRSIV
jgi:DNA-binding NarL/FixJ family response regulator